MKHYRTAVTVLFFFLISLLTTQPLAEARIACPTLTPRAYLPIITTQQHNTMTISIIQPYATTNMLTNPSAETATTNFTAIAGSLARSTTQQKRGAYSIAVTPTTTTTDGAYYGTVSLVNGTTYTFSVDVWGVVGIPYRIYVGSTAAAVLGTPTTFTGTGTWQRVEVSYTETSSTTRRLYMVKNSSASTGVFYVDGLQLEALSFSTTYCDGDQTGCLWSGGAHTSASSRSSQVRAGGKKINLNTLRAFLVSQQGTGMPPVTNQTTAYASIDGSFLNKQSVKERPFTIVVSTSGDGVREWHANRQALIDLVKPNLVYPQQPFVLVYDDGGKELRLSCWYDGGLEMADGKQDIETVAIKCLATDPMWTTDGNDGAALTVQQSLSTNYLMYRDAGGVWSVLGSGMDGPINHIVQGLDNAIYFGGGFTTAGGTTVNGIAKWDGSAFSALGTGVNTGSVLVLAVGPDGFLYAGGTFTTMGGVANTARIAKWNGSAWSALGTGMNGQVNGITFGIDGTLYATGSFTSAGGTGVNFIAKWNGSAWSALGTGLGLNGLALATDPAGNIYVGGNFTSVGGTATSGGGKWDGTTWSTLAQGLSTNNVRALSFGLDGTLYAGGSFTTDGNGVPMQYIAKWNGSVWSALGSGLAGTSGYVTKIAVDGNGQVYAAGKFDTAGGITLPDHIAKWNGSAWTFTDFDSPGTEIFAVLSTQNNELYIATQTTGTAITAAVTTVTNTGSAKAFPKIVINGPTSGSSRIYQLINYTTGKAIYLNYAINAGEKATFDFTPGKVSFTSTFRGNILNTILPGSVMSDFSLLPGNNNISFYAASSTVTATMTWLDRCMSVDSSGT